MIITPYKEGILHILFDEDRKPLELHYTGRKAVSCAGNIYVGRVRDVVKNIKAAFLDIGNGKKAYYSLEDKAVAFYTKKGSSKEIQQGDELLVQIKKDAVKTKDPAVTTEISISSVYFVGFLNQTGIHYSGKLSDTDKERIREILSESDEKDFGLIVRTNAAQASKEDILEDRNRLFERLETIRKKAPFYPGGTCIHQMPASYLTFLKDQKQDSLTEILTDDPDIYQELLKYVQAELPHLSKRCSFYQDRLLPLSSLYCVDSAVSEAFQEKIWLKSGGYLVIQETEALTVVDVNSGKFSAKKDQENSFLKINLEAAKETARQLRLRNLSGIIIVDFINQKKQESREILLKEFRQYLHQDPVKAAVVDITALGLVEVTRQRIRGTIKEQFRS